MASEFTVKTLKAITGEKDANGNIAYNISFDEIEGTYFMLAQKAPVVGGKEFGEVLEAVGKSGKPYTKFRRLRRDEHVGAVAQATSNATPTHDNSSYEDGMAWGNALTNATSLVTTFGNKSVSIPHHAESVILIAHQLVNGRNNAETVQAEAPKLVKPEALNKAQQPAENPDLPPVDLYDEEPVDLDNIGPF